MAINESYKMKLFSLFNCYSVNKKNWQQYFKKSQYNNFIMMLKQQKDKPIFNLNENKEILNELIENLTEDYKEQNAYEFNQIMNKTKAIYLKQQVEENTKVLKDPFAIDWHKERIRHFRELKQLEFEASVTIA